MQAIILSGGKGTRLKPLTDNTPKPMLEIGGKPHLEHIISLLRKYGVADIIFSTGYLHEKISDYFGDGSKFGVKIQYREDGDIPLGTGGAIKNCEDLITSDSFIVFNGDILTDIDLIRFMSSHLFNSASNNKITIALNPVDDPSSFGVAVLDYYNRILDFIEKPKDLSYGNLINSGVYMFDKCVLDVIPKNTYYMVETELFPIYAENKSMFGHVIDAYWIDIGTHERFTKANKDIHTIKI